MLTMGCARNDVDSEELAGRLEAGGWELTDGDDDDTDVIMVNTCGFIDAAKKDSIDALLAAADSGAKVVAVGCLAQRYGKDLAAQLPEANAVLSFDDYVDISERLDDVLEGRPLIAHTPTDRRTLLPISPVERPAAAQALSMPGHGLSDTRGIPASGPRVMRKRLTGGPVAPLKLASGCDRRCTFCAIPAFRGSFVSRPPEDIIDEARWLIADGVKELVLVSENSTSYGKDLGDVRLLESLIDRLGGLDELARFRVAYLQPAEIRPGLLETLLGARNAAAYLDISFQHSSAAVLRRMKRFGSTDGFLTLIEHARAINPYVGFRTNIIVGFPGENAEDLAQLERFLTDGRLDAVGVFGYSDEDGTAAADFDGKIDKHEIDARVEYFSSLVEELTAQRAEDRIGERVDVLVEQIGPDFCEGRAEHQGPEVDGSTMLEGFDLATIAVGDILRAEVIATDGIDLIATPVAGNA
ncbi:MAG: 30S ribosomal protein S12 methylthiotransferase RimO [Antricoccus sp.]